MRNQDVFALGGILLLCLCPLSFAGQTGYRAIHVGAQIAGLPFPCTDDAVYCEGEFEGQWIRTDAIDGKILTIDVIYSGETLHRVVIAGSPITLAQAIKLHSLQPGFAEPILGSAKDRDGKTYGIADVANDIVYHCSGTEPISTVKTVTYLSADAPVLETAARLKLGKQWKLAASSGPDSKAIHQLDFSGSI